MNEKPQSTPHLKKTHPLWTVFALCALALGIGGAAASKGGKISSWHNRIAQTLSPAYVHSLVEKADVMTCKDVRRSRSSWRTHLQGRSFGVNARMASEASGTHLWLRSRFALDAFLSNSGFLSAHWRGVFGLGCGFAHGNSGCRLSFGMENNID
jgi:hypothetical protein